MGTMRRIFYFLLPGIFLAWLAWFLRTPHEPVYQGKTLTAWLEEATASDIYTYENSNPGAVNAIRHIGTNALPELLGMISSKDSRVLNALLELHEKFSWIPIPTSAEQKHRMAINGFFVLGETAKPALQNLVGLLDNEDSDVRSDAVCCIAMIGPSAKDAVPALISGMNSGRLDQSTAFAFLKIGPGAASAEPFLRKFLETKPNPWAAPTEAALIEIGADSILPFFERLKDTSNQTNWAYAAWVISLCRDKAEPGVPLLLAGLANTNRGIVHFALMQLDAIHLRPDLCVPAIIPFLQSSNRNFREYSFSALRQFGSASEQAVPELMKSLNDDDDWVRFMATNALREIDPEAAAKAGIK